MTRPEEVIAPSLRAILIKLPDGGHIARDERFGAVLSSLERFLPEVLAEIHREWRRESFDGVLPLRARRVSEIEAEVIGHCILLSDQTIAPFHLCLQIGPLKDEVPWLELRLGERGDRGMVRLPYHFPRASTRLLQALENAGDRIHWAYQVTYGEKRP